MQIQKTSVSTAIAWDDRFNNKTSDFYKRKAEAVQIDLQSLLEKSSDVERAHVTILDFTKPKKSRKRRAESGNKASVDFTADVEVPINLKARDVKNSINNVVAGVDPDEFETFNENIKSITIEFVDQATDIPSSTEAKIESKTKSTTALLTSEAVPSVQASTLPVMSCFEMTSFSIAIILATLCFV